MKRIAPIDIARLEWWETAFVAWLAFLREFAGHLGLPAPPVQW